MTNAIALALTVYCSISTRRTDRARGLRRVSATCVIVAAANVAASIWHADEPMLLLCAGLLVASTVLHTH